MWKLCPCLVAAPFSIDSTDPAVVEAGLRNFPGRALINSVSDKPGVKEQIFALAKKYGAAVLVLPLEEKGCREQQRKDSS
ncbi:MAG: dihydropteroate synthase [Acidaminococcaceae bacterium]